ncbi:MAG: DUF4130 domain-containing protein [Clostridia bacterium]|nr:DUF4130 domain-containing protein [Clostridia bacterium]
MSDRDDYGRTLFQDAETLDAGQFSLQEVHELYKEAYGPVFWLLTGRQAEQLAGTIFYASRHKAEDRHGLIIQALNQAVVKGIGYVLGKVSPEAGMFLNRAREVSKELHRVKGFARLTPLEDGDRRLMMSRVQLEHNIGDLVLKYFLRRFRGYTVVLLANGRAYYNDGNQICVANQEDLGMELPEDDFEAFWDAYYDTQWIEGRLNHQLARKHLPKKLWSWVKEGKKLDLR